MSIISNNNKDNFEAINEMWNFRPLFTIQPNVHTRDKQMKIWKDIIFQHAVHSGYYCYYCCYYYYYIIKVII